MRKKLRRRRRVFSRRNRVKRSVRRALPWLLVIPVMIGGYFLAMWLFDGSNRRPVDAPPVSETTGATTAPTSPQGGDEPDTPAPEKPNTSALKGLRGMYLPASALGDLDAWADTLAAAKAAGINAVIFDAKNADGTLLYASETELAAEARAVDDGALTLAALKEAAATLAEQYGMTAVPRLYAFRDNTAPRYLESARVSVVGSPSSVWYDAAPANGGRRWLNPYSADARRYVTALAKELHGAGFSLVMLDGVQFPDQESKAYYGDAEQTALSRAELFAKFAGELNDAVGKNGWLLTSTALASVGEETTVYGGNPLTFGAPALSPWVMPSAFGKSLSLGGDKVSSPAKHPYEASALLLSQLKARLQLMSGDTPVIVPWLQADAAAEQLRALTECFGEDAPYLLYRADGKYAF